MPLACVRSESLISAYLGQTGQNIGKLFEAMSESEGRVVVFFEEVDALGGRRMNDQGASVEGQAASTSCCCRIEMFQGIALAATCVQDFLDPALWRRFGMQIGVDLPGHDECFAIVRRYAAPFELDDDETDEIVVATAGRRRRSCGC